MEQDLKKTVFFNTISSYLLLFLRLIVAIFITKILFQGLGEAYYGFWILLWSFFGYSLFLDFGFGISMQKYSAEVSVSKEYSVFNSMLSTVFFSYTIVSAIIVVLTIIFSMMLENIFNLGEGLDLPLLKKVFLIFGLGTAFIFPTGIFSEILTGFKKIFIKNMISVAELLIYFVGIYFLIGKEWGIYWITIFTIILNLAKNIGMWVSVKRLAPEVSISLSLFRFSRLKELTNFSVFAYLIICGNMIIYKTDQIILGVVLGMEAVAIYQISTRLPEMFHKFATQFQENLSPIAASLYKSGEHRRLESILLRSNQYIAFVAFSLYIIISFLVRPILYVWLNIDNPEIIYVAYVMNFSMFLLILFRSGSSKVLLMTGKERVLASIAVAETFINLILSLILVRIMGVVGVAYGTLIPNMIFSIFFIFPLAIKSGNSSISHYIRRVIIPTLLISVPPVIMLCFVTYYTPLHSWNLLKLLTVTVLIGTVYLIMGYSFLLTDKNRLELKSTLQNFRMSSPR